MEDIGSEIANYARLYREEGGKARVAAYRAAVEAGEPRPRTDRENTYAQWLTRHGRSWSQTPQAEHRLEEAVGEHAYRGAEAFVRGLPGNAYTDHLVARFGRHRMPPPRQATQSPRPEGVWAWYTAQHSTVRRSLVGIFLAWYVAFVLGWILPSTTGLVQRAVAGLLVAGIAALVSVSLILVLLGILVYLSEPQRLPGRLRSLVDWVAGGFAVGMGVGFVLWLFNVVGYYLSKRHRWPDFWPALGGFGFFGAGVVLLFVFWAIVDAGASHVKRLFPPRLGSTPDAPRNPATGGSLRLPQKPA